jgi:hypothetical protein
MIVCSIHDPALFDAALFEKNRHYEGHLSGHLDRVMHAHLIACDQDENGSVIGQSIAEAALKLPALGMKINAMLNPQRIIYLPADPPRREKIMKWLDRAGSAEAVGLIGHAKVDVFVAAEDTYEAMQAETITLDRTCTLATYHTHPCSERERRAMGGYPLQNMSKADFLAEIIDPLVYWAREVTIIDKYLIKAAFGEKGDGRQGGNWSKFRSTLKSIHDRWCQGPFADVGTFRVISVHNNFKVGNELAEHLARKLNLGCRNLHISLKPEHEVATINHDRYLVTDRQFAIGITRGFDLIADKQPCGVADAYLRQSDGEQDLITTLMHARPRGEWQGAA